MHMHKYMYALAFCFATEDYPGIYCGLSMQRVEQKASYISAKRISHTCVKTLD